MSFPRAKIQRFNDAKSCAPAPGSYDPKFEGKVKGAVIEKSERFMSQSSSSTESPGNLSVTSSSCKSGNLNCLPIFRTPQLPRKQNKQVNTAPQVKVKLSFEQLQKSDSAGKVDAELYDALLVERDNKDATIKENEAYIEHLRECIRKLEEELQGIKSEEQKLDERNEEKIEEMLLKQSKELSDLKLELHKVKEICCDMEKLLDEKELSLLTYKQDKEDLLLQIRNLKEKEIENRSSYEVNVKELNDYYKKLEEEVAELKAAVAMKEELEERVEKLKEHVGILSDGNSDLNCKLNQKQQLILCLQGELSCATLELEECKSENEKMTNDFSREKETLIDKHNSEIEEKLSAIEDLKKLIAEEREMRQTLQENIMNGSVVRENLESSISDKEAALLVLRDKYDALETAYLQQENAQETRLAELTRLHDEKINDLKTKANEKTDEVEMKLKALRDKYCALEAEYDKTCLEHKLVTEAQRLEMDEVHKKYEIELNETRALVYEKNEELGSMREEVESTTLEVEKHVKAMEEKLKNVEETLNCKINDYEDDAARMLEDSESKLEMKFQQLAGEVSSAVEDLRKVTHHRDKLRISNMEHQLTIVELQDKIDTLVTELNANKESYEADLAFIRNEHNVSKRQCKKLNIGIANIQASLEALRKRLLDSEHDVEQMTLAFHQVKTQKAAADEQIKMLRQELETARASMARLEKETMKQIEEVRNGLFIKLEEFRMKAEKNVTAKEEEILEHRHKIEELSARIFELNETLSAVEETNTEHEHEIEALTEKLDHQRECAHYATQQIAKLEGSNAIYQHQIQNLTAELEYQKDFSRKASDHIATLATVKTKKEREISDLSAELNSERDKVTKLSSEIRYFSSYKDEVDTVLQNYHCDCKIGEKVCQHQERIAEMNSDGREFKKILDAVVESRILETKQDFQRSLAEAETRASLAEHWQNKCKELEALIGPFREQLEIFKEECKALELKKEAAEEQVRELSLQYAEILGHQNHNQKIKHLIKLKEQNFDLTKEVERLEEQVRSQKRIIDKFKMEQPPALKQVLQQNSKGKENVENALPKKSPLKSTNVKPLKSYR